MIDRRFITFAGSNCCSGKSMSLKSRTTNFDCGCEGGSKMHTPAKAPSSYTVSSWGPGVQDVTKFLSNFNIDLGSGGQPMNYYNCDEYTCCSGTYGVGLDGKWHLYLSCWSRSDDRTWFIEI